MRPYLQQLLGKLPGQRGVVLCGEITQCVPDRQHLLLGREYPLALGRVVDLFVIGFSGGQPVGNARADVILELLQCHIAQILLATISNTSRLGPFGLGRKAGRLRPRALGRGTSFARRH